MWPHTLQPGALSGLTMNPNTHVLALKSASGLVLWLLCGLAVASLYAWLNLSGIIRMGLGWSVRPGFIVLFFIITFGAIELRKMQLLRLIQIVFCLFAAIFLEYFPLSRPIDSFVEIALTLFGACILFNSAQRIRVSTVVLLLVCSYIQSVCIYNLFRGEQMMFFFKPGWTV
jgi:hypothetical protein